MRLIVAVLLALALTACAHRPSLKERRDAWESTLARSMGTDINDMITNVGPPTGTYQMPNGNIIYTWTAERRSYSTSSAQNPNFYPKNARFQPGPTTSGYVQENVSSCATHFTAGKDQKIIAWSWEGNSCF